MQAGREWSKIFNMLTGKKKSRILYPAKVSFRNEEDIDFLKQNQGNLLPTDLLMYIKKEGASKRSKER